MKTTNNIIRTAILVVVLTAVPLLNIRAQGEKKLADVQGFHIGGRFGLGEASIVSQGLRNVSPKLAISGGVASNYQFNKYIGLNVDLLLSSLGARNQDAEARSDLWGGTVKYAYKERFDLLYAEVPLTGQLNIWFGDFFIRGYAGPGLNFKLLAMQTREYEDPDFNDQNGYTGKDIYETNNISSSMIYGLGIGAADKEDRIFFLDFRLNRSMSSLGKINSNTAFSNYYCISAGYLF